MAAETYNLQDFIADVDRIARAETAAEVITGRVSPLLARLVKNPEGPRRHRGRPQPRDLGRDRRGR